MLDEQTPADAGPTPAGPADPSGESRNDTSPPEAPAKPARKRAPRKTTAKQAASVAAQDDAAQDVAATDPDASPPAPDSAAAPEEAPAPARKRAPRKTAAKKAAAPPPEPGDPLHDASTGASDAQAQAVGAPEIPTARTVKKSTRRTTKKAAAVPEESTAAAATSPVEVPAAPTPAAPVEAPTGESTEAPQRPQGEAADAVTGEETDDTAAVAAQAAPPATTLLFQPPDPAAGRRTRKRATKKAGPPAPAPDAPADDLVEATVEAEAVAEDEAAMATETVEEALPETTDEATDSADDEGDDEGEGEGGARRRRRRGGRRRRKPAEETEDAGESADAAEQASDESEGPQGVTADQGEGDVSGSRRRRRRRRTGDGEENGPEESDTTVARVRKPRNAEDEITGFTGSTRLEAKKQRRREGREAGRRRAPIISEAEFLARRESVDRKMVIRQRGDLTQIAVLEDKVLVEHYVARESQTSLIGNVYLGRVQNVLPSMEAAFIDIGKGRNAVLYAGEVNWDALGAKDGKQRKIEQVLKSGQSVLVQVSKDPIGHKGARLTSQISLPGRFLVYVPDGTTSGISRKLPDNERNRLKSLLKEIVPDTAGVIVRTAAEGASESELTRDVERLKALWEDIESKVEGGNAPQLLYGEPDLTLKVVRDLFTEDIATLVISGEEAWEMVQQYVEHVAPDLADRLERHDDSERDAFAEYRIDEQIAKGLDRKVWLPSGGSLVIDRTEAMTVVDVNTGKFTGSGGNLEETVTKNNLEAAEEIVRQLRLRDIGGIIVVDFIDMVLESNRDLVLRRLIECLGRDRTRHQVAEVTSLGLVQMTRKRIGTGLLEAFSESCEACQGRGLVIHQEPVEQRKRPAPADDDIRRPRRGRGRRGEDPDEETQKDSEPGGRDGRGNGGKDDRKRRDHGTANGGGGRRPTPAEFAAMVRSEAAAADADPAGTTSVEGPAMEPVTEPVTEPGTEPGTGPVTEAVTAAESAVPEERPEDEVAARPEAESAPEPAPATEAESAPEPAPPSVPTGPRIVTSVRRVGARRPAGPPAGSLTPTGTGGASTFVDGAADATSVDQSGRRDEADQGGGPQPEHEEAVHVPVKKKGTRKR